MMIRCQVGNSESKNCLLMGHLAAQHLPTRELCASSLGRSFAALITMFGLASSVLRSVPAAAAVAGVAAGAWATACGSSVAHADALDAKEWRKFRLTAKTQVSPDSAEYRFSFPKGHEFDRLGLEPASLLMARAKVGGTWCINLRGARCWHWRVISTLRSAGDNPSRSCVCR